MSLWPDDLKLSLKISKRQEIRKSKNSGAQTKIKIFLLEILMYNATLCIL
nr:10708_t:CDS:2 [Entrophospora candida]